MRFVPTTVAAVRAIILMFGALVGPLACSVDPSSFVGGNVPSQTYEQRLSISAGSTSGIESAPLQEDRLREAPRYADDMGPAAPPFSFSATGGFLYGRISGYLQTPAGGDPGTTSHNRPSLGELGIDRADIGVLGVSGRWGPHEGFGGAEIIRVSGNSTLESDLVTHGVTFPAGTHVSSDVSLDWYRFGYRYHFDFDTGTTRPQFAFAPYADVVLWNYDYKIQGGGTSTSRGYLKPTVQGGFQAEWRPGGGPFSVAADLSASPPGVSSLPFIAAEQFTASYGIPVAPTANLTLKAGVRFEQMNYFDNQTVPNHVRVDLGPLFIIGVGVEF